MNKNFYIISFFFILNFFKCQYTTLIEYSYGNYDDTKAILLGSNTENITFLTSHNKGQIKYEEALKDFGLVNTYYLFKYNTIENNVLQKVNAFVVPNVKFESDIALDEILKLPKWNITTEKKEILGYICTKAVGGFRGRDWIVWFTTGVNNSIFPWKLSGLPGAILEAEDPTKVFSMKAVRFVTNGNFEISEKMKSFFDIRNKKPVAYRKVADVMTKWFKEIQNKSIAQLPVGAEYKVLHYRYGELEKTFEWEDSKKP